MLRWVFFLSFLLNSIGSFLSWIMLGPFLVSAFSGLELPGWVAMFRQFSFLGGAILGGFFADHGSPIRKQILVEWLQALAAIVLLVVLNNNEHQGSSLFIFWSIFRFFLGGVSFVLGFKILAQISKHLGNASIDHMILTQGAMLFAPLVGLALPLITQSPLKFALAIDVVTTLIYIAVLIPFRKEIRSESMTLHRPTIAERFREAAFSFWSKELRPWNYIQFFILVGISGYAIISLHTAQRQNASSMTMLYAFLSLSYGVALWGTSFIIKKMKSLKILLLVGSAFLFFSSLTVFFWPSSEEIKFASYFLYVTAFWILLHSSNKGVLEGADPKRAGAVRSAMILYLSIIFGGAELLFGYAYENGWGSQIVLASRVAAVAGIIVVGLSLLRRRSALSKPSVESLLLRSMNRGALAASLLALFAISAITIRGIWTTNRSIERLLVSYSESITHYASSSNDFISIQRALNNLNGALKGAFDIDPQVKLYFQNDLVAEISSPNSPSIFRSKLRQRVQSPSQKEVFFEIDVDHSSAILNSLFLLIVIQVLIVCLFYLGRRILYRSLNPLVEQMSQTVKWTETMAVELRDEREKLTTLPDSRILELSQLSFAMNHMGSRLLELQKEVKTSEFNRGQYELAVQVAHDIRSPLFALQTTLNNDQDLPAEKRMLLEAVTMRIKEIANDLLTTFRNQKSQPIKKASNKINPIDDLLDPLLLEKRLQFNTRSEVRIEKAPQSISGAMILVEPTEFRRVISNLLNNAVEAVVGSGKVSVAVETSEGNAVIKIRDSGVGIDPKTLSSLMQAGETYGKKNGTGLGLYHAKKSLESWGGKIEIDSQLNQFTEVKLTLPLAPVQSATDSRSL